MNPARARLKRSVRAAIELCGGGEGAAITVGRRPATVYEWGNLNTEAFPPLDCVFAMDEIALAQLRTPPILHALSAELTHVSVRLPFVMLAPDGCVIQALAEVSAEFGAIASEVVEATRDGVIDQREKDRIVLSIDQTISALTRMRAVVRAPEIPATTADRATRPP